MFSFLLNRSGDLPRNFNRNIPEKKHNNQKRRASVCNTVGELRRQRGELVAKKHLTEEPGVGEKAARRKSSLGAGTRFAHRPRGCRGSSPWGLVQVPGNVKGPEIAQVRPWVTEVVISKNVSHTQNTEWDSGYVVIKQLMQWGRTQQLFILPTDWPQAKLMTKLVLSAQGNFKAGLHLLPILPINCWVLLKYRAQRKKQDFTDGNSPISAWNHGDCVS